MARRSPGRRRTSTVEALAYRDIDWSIAACKNLPAVLFYPTWATSGRYSTKSPVRMDVKRLCGSCPIKIDCRTWGLHHEVYGIWGGLSRGQRHEQRKKLGITLVNPYNGKEPVRDRRAEQTQGTGSV